MRHPGKYRRHRLDCHDLKIIHDLVAKKLSTVNGITSDDLRDIEHDVVLVLLRRMEKFDPAINKWAAFRAVVIYHTLTDIIRKHVGPDSEINRRADFTLDDRVPGSKPHSPVFYRDLVNSDMTIADGTEKDDSERLALVMDIRMVAARLPDELREICEYIVREGCKSPVDIMEPFGISRKTAFRRFLEIRKVFISHGITG